MLRHVLLGEFFTSLGFASENGNRKDKAAKSGLM